MNKVLLFTFFAFGLSNAFAQQADSVSMGGGSPTYPNDVYYNIGTGEKDTFPNTNWHLAFSMRHAMGLPGVTIRANEGRGVTVYKAPFTIASWSAIHDTSGLSGWSQLHNDNHTWDVGALNMSRDTTDPFDMGWGQYDMASHDIVGTRLFIISIGSGSSKTYRKVIINRLAYDSLYSITSANVDGSDSATSTFVKSTFVNKMFGYYSFTTKLAINREPNHPWDLLFTYYKDSATFPPYPVAYYPFMGVLQAPQLSVARVKGIPKIAADTTNAGFYSKNISSIGWEWKKVYLGPPPSGPYELTDSLTYFIKSDHDSSRIMKLYFTMFNNTPVNNIVFNKTQILTHVGIAEVSVQKGLMTIYPNPASDIVYVKLNNAKSAAQIRLTDLTGKVVYQYQKDNQSEESVIIPVSGLLKGIYFVTVETSAGAEVRKLILN